MKISFSPPDITEEEIKEVVEALRSGWITTGPRTKKFEEEIAALCGTKRAVALGSATACMEMTLRAMGIKAGDEVIEDLGSLEEGMKAEAAAADNDSAAETGETANE